jgi:hypothetical protein
MNRIHGFGRGHEDNIRKYIRAETAEEPTLRKSGANAGLKWCAGIG